MTPVDANDILRARGPDGLREALDDPRADVTAKIMRDLEVTKEPLEPDTPPAAPQLEDVGPSSKQIAADSNSVDLSARKPPVKRSPPKLAVVAASGSLPTIRLEAGNIEAIVDQVERALINAGRGLYQRSGMIVSVGHEPALAAHGRNVVIQRIAERGDHALLEDICATVKFERYDARVKVFVAKDPPMALVKTLKQRFGRLKFPPLTGTVNAPTMRADGTLLSEPGYDAATGLLYDPLDTEFPAVSDKPTRRDAEQALAQLTDLIGSFPFVEEIDLSVALSAILTACVRRSFPTAPLHAFTAPVAGSGKSKLVDVASIISFGHEAAVLAQGHTEEELEKRLGAVLPAGDGAVSLDNCERPLAGDLLCQMLTQTRVLLPILGKSQTPDLSTNAFLTALAREGVAVRPRQGRR